MKILRQKEYAFRDYEGLDEIAKHDLRENRAEIAKNLWKKRKKINNQYNTDMQTRRTKISDALSRSREHASEDRDVG